MNIVFYVLYLSRMQTMEPMAKYDSLKECKVQAIELNNRAKKNKQKIKYFCDQVRDNYVSKPFDYLYVLDIPYCDEKNDCSFK
jgi:hypothetical protein